MLGARAGSHTRSGRSPPRRSAPARAPAPSARSCRQGRDAERAHLPRPALGDRVLTHRQRRVGALPQRLAKLVQELLHTLPLDALARVAINTGGPRPPVAFHPLPRDEQRRGVADEVEEIAEAFLPLLACPAVQLGLPSQYPLLRLLGVERRGRIHARPPERLLTPPSCCPPSPCAGLSRLGLLRGLRHAPAASAGIGPCRPPPAARRLRGASHVHCDPFDRVGSRLYPCSASEEQSQRLPRPPTPILPGPERPAVFKGTVVAASRPMSARFRAGLRIEGASTTALLSLCLSVSLARARASGSTARPSRCRGCSHRSRAIPHHGCPQLHQAAASARGRHPSRHG